MLSPALRAKRTGVFFDVVDYMFKKKPDDEMIDTITEESKLIKKGIASISRTPKAKINKLFLKETIT